MDFTLSEDQSALHDLVTRFIDRDYGFHERQALKDTPEGFSRDKWARLAELGLLSLPFPEAFGGLGGTALDTMIVMESFGRGLVLEPYLSTIILAGNMVCDAGTAEQKAALLPALAEGSLLMALAHYEPHARYDLSQVETKAVPEGSGWKLSGTKAVVVGGAAADTFLVSAKTADGSPDGHGVSLFLVDAGADGVTVAPYPTQDGGRAADLRLDGVHVPAGSLVGKRDEGLPAIERGICRANVALCAEAVGIMSALLPTTVEYLKTRKQFGVPIGTFQALKHRMADMYIACEQARSITCLAAARVDAPGPREIISGAKALVARNARFVGQEAVQLHGGMGVTDELIVGHYFKRLTMIAATFGDFDHHLGRFSDSLRQESTG